MVHSSHVKNGLNASVSWTPSHSGISCLAESTKTSRWYKEKALYMAEAAKYGLTTNERDIDSNKIYTTLYKRGQLDFFYKVGHYLQMMDKNFNSISAAYCSDPNPYNNLYEVGFHTASNERFNNGTLLSADAYEQAIRNFAGAAKAADAQATVAKNQLAMLRAQKTGYVSTLNIQKAKLADLQKLAANRSGALATANAELITAEAALTKAKQNIATKEAALKRATAMIASQLAPKQAALAKEQNLLETAKNKLVELKKALIIEELNLAKAKDALQTSQIKLIPQISHHSNMTTSCQRSNSSHLMIRHCRHMGTP